MKELLMTYWAEIALAILTAAGTITALTETEKDDKVVDVLKRIINAVVLGRTKRRNKE
jgi:hypothetical protein